MPTARKHHYLPQCYLKGFAQLGGKNWQTWTLDTKEKRQFKTNIEKVAAIRDFNRIDVQGLPIDAIEQAMSSLESKFAEVFVEIAKTRILPKGENFHVLLNFIALIAARTPQFRNQMESFHDRMGRISAQMLTADKEVWDRMTAAAKARGANLDDSVAYEDVKKFVDSDAYGVKLPSPWRLELEMTAVDTVLNTLLYRKWTTLVAADETGGFICCDRPVSLQWVLEKDESPPRLYGPGFGMAKTRLIVPLNHDVALLGDFELGGGEIIADRTHVAAVNYSILIGAERQIYSRNRDFYYLGKEMEIMESARLMSQPEK